MAAPSSGILVLDSDTLKNLISLIVDTVEHSNPDYDPRDLCLTAVAQDILGSGAHWHDIEEAKTPLYSAPLRGTHTLTANAPQNKPSSSLKSLFPTLTD
jgi:hypothetical protein